MTEIDVFNSDEEYNEYLMDLAYAPLIEFEMECLRRREELFKVIIKIKGKAFVRQIKEYIEDLDVVRMYIRNKPFGKPQKESNFKHIKEVYIEQWTSGPECDMYAGNISIEIKKDKFLIIPYSC